MGGYRGSVMLGEIFHPGIRTPVMINKWESEAGSFPSDKACLHELQSFSEIRRSSTTKKQASLISGLCYNDRRRDLELRLLAGSPNFWCG